MKNVVIPALVAAVVAAAFSWFVVRSADSGAPLTSSGASTGNRAALSADDLAQRLMGYKKNPDTTTLLLTKESGACKAEVGSDPIGNLNDKRVFWLVLNDTDYPCDLNDAYPKIKLVFTPVGGQYPFSTREVPSKHTPALDFVFEKIKKLGSHPNNEVNYGLYPYKVYLLNGKTTNPAVPILDPDLEVEEGNRNPPPAAAPTDPASAPAKKQ